MKVAYLIFSFLIISQSICAQQPSKIGDAKIALIDLATGNDPGLSNLPTCAGPDYSCGAPYKIRYIFIGTGSWNISSNWNDNTIPPSILPSDAEIIINPLSTGECLLDSLQTITPGAEFMIIPGKVFRVNSSLVFQK